MSDSSSDSDSRQNTSDDAFYRPLADGAFESTVLTVGPWAPDSQHVGPPAALLGRALRSAAPNGGLLVRVTIEILRPVPVATLRPRARVVRPGRSVQLLEGVLADADGDVLRATAWWIRTTATPLAGVETPGVTPPPGPENGRDEPFFDVAADVGYHTGMEWRFVEGSFVDPGPATVWMRMRVPLVAGEETDQLTRVLIAADSGNGVSAQLDPADHLFVNTDLSVHLQRVPDGEWVCLDARSHLEADGVGVADTELFDETGRIGRSVQSLFVAAQEGRPSDAVTG